jgi:GTP-binding protein
LKFVDQAKIYVSSGHGGAGCVSFRREKYIPRGGPDGGNGGRGGDVIIVATSQKETLLRFHFNQHFAARAGQPGRGRNQTGENGGDLVVNVPPGTMVKDAETEELLFDLALPGARCVVAKGGRGGQGNAGFASSTMRSPRFAQPGGDKEERRILLELRLLADAALVGYPNVGKSTLVSRLSAARPKIADYAFTTLVPHLGVVEAGEESSFVLADLPGLIDGASRGLGLGHQFLKHVSRAAVLVHVLDPQRMDLEAPLKDLRQIEAELKKYDPALLRKPKLVALGKMDLEEGPPALAAYRRVKSRAPLYPFSAVTGEGLDPLRWAIWERVRASRGSH